MKYSDLTDPTAPADPVLDMAAIFKALGNPQRLALFTMLYRMGGGTGDAGCCAGVDRAFSACCERVDLSRSTVSHHFKELQNAGLITCTRNGQAMTCHVNAEALKAVRGFPG